MYCCPETKSKVRPKKKYAIAGDYDVIPEGFKSSKNLENGNSSVTDQCVSSLTNIDPDAITHPDLRIGWEVLRERCEQYEEI